MAAYFYFTKGVTTINIETTFDVRVTSVRGLNPTPPKAVFQRDWATEHGVDTYIPATSYPPKTRKRQAGEVIITFFAELKDDQILPIDKYDAVCAYLFDEKVTYSDTLQWRSVELIYNTNKPAWYHFIPGNEQLMFEITFLNPSGLITNTFE